MIFGESGTYGKSRGCRGVLEKHDIRKNDTSEQKIRGARKFQKVMIFEKIKKTKNGTFEKIGRTFKIILKAYIRNRIQINIENNIKIYIKSNF